MNNSSSLSRSRRQPKQKRGQQRVEKILLAAAEVFSEVGYSAASTQQIAHRADTAVGSIYQFFPDKLAIFHALEREYLQQGDNLNREFFAHGFSRPLKSVIGDLIDSFALFLEQPIAHCIWLHCYQPHVPGLFQVIQVENGQIDRESIAKHADCYRQRNPSLSKAKSELLSETAHSMFGSMFVHAFKNPADRRIALYSELKDALYGYLQPHIGDHLLPDAHNDVMTCPHCQSDRVAKNGHHQGKQRYICRACSRQFVAHYTPRGYPPETKQQCLLLHQQGLSFREIERRTGVSHNTAINWSKEK
jgi:AcrR family transcriptional regulator